MFNVNSFNERANSKGFPNIKVADTQHTLNDIRLSYEDDAKYGDDTLQADADTSRQMKVGTLDSHGRIKDVTHDFIKEAVILTVTDIAGTRDVAMRFLASFTDPIETFDDYFTPKVQTRLREALERVYTIMQTITPTRYLNYVLKGGEFSNFAELFNRICEDRHIMKETPSVPQSFLFFRDIRGFKQCTARSKAIAMEE